MKRARILSLANAARMTAILVAAALLLVGCGQRASTPQGGTAPQGDTTPAPQAGQPPADTGSGAGTGTSSGSGAAQPNSIPDGQPVVIKVFFTFGPSQTDIGKPTAVTRQVPKDKATIRGALEELLKGPTAEERAAGYTSWFSEKTAGMVKGVSLHGGRAIVDFANFSRIIPNASSSAGARMLLGELSTTVFQFSNVREVEYRFDGDNEKFMNWLQMSAGTISAGQYR